MNAEKVFKTMIFEKQGESKDLNGIKVSTHHSK